MAHSSLVMPMMWRPELTADLSHIAYQLSQANEAWKLGNEVEPASPKISPIELK